jgi:hypothetical protein
MLASEIPDTHKQTRKVTGRPLLAEELRVLPLQLHLSEHLAVVRLEALLQLPALALLEVLQESLQIVQVEMLPSSSELHS